MLRQALIALAFACLFVLASSTARSPSAWADTPSDAGVTDAGSGSAKAAPAVADPAEHPAAALDEMKLARKTSWPLALWLALAMLGKALAYGRDKLKSTPLVGKLAALLAKGKGAMAVAAIGTVGAAGYAALLDGGTLSAALVASGVALAGVMHSTTKTTDGAPAVSSPS